ncbi:MAG: septum formation protein Maf [Prolixibacteraceae bacterium]|nr:septum formation protein Maf [Prolixibacteraceae bacterium]MBT6764355.1 septum formation protein Maf [Prolixibacteraceae bacterium]MBT6999742.1 septum formation protein Maf [Prolixibacteraceae bacterium]MBT7396308.1 septum formation protein Maf [Prolixibacteraceae bacterium]
MLFSMKWFPGYNFILASKSPRRQQLLNSLGIEFQVKTKEIEENYPENLRKEEIPVFLAELKSKPFLSVLKENDLLITADTIVWFDGLVLGKPRNEEEAIGMLQKLSGNEHQVISGVCITSSNKQKSFYAVSNVRFKKLTKKEINYYVSEFKPFDKAGGYGIQEWIGVIGIIHIEGSFYNVMGLPIQKLYEEIQKF